MKIIKEYYDKETGLTFYPGEHDMDAGTAARAAKAGVVDGVKSGGKSAAKSAGSAADKSLSKMTKADLIAEVERLREGGGDADNTPAIEPAVKPLSAQVDGLKGQLAKAEEEIKALKAARENQSKNYAALNADAEELLAAAAARAPKGQKLRNLRDLTAALRDAPPVPPAPTPAPNPADEKK